LNDFNEDFQNYFNNNNPNSHPGYLYGDFNGDQNLDHAVLTRCVSNRSIVEKFIILLGKSNGEYQLVQIAQWDDPLSLNNLFIQLVPVGEVKEYDSPEMHVLKYPGVALNGSSGFVVQQNRVKVL